MWPKSILLESQALSEVLECIEGRGDYNQARRFTREALSHLESNDLSELVLQCAMTRVLGETIQLKLPEKSLMAPIFVETSRRWIFWATGKSLSNIPFLPLDSEGAIQTLSLNFWFHAVKALFEAPHESQRLFRRATEFSSSYGVQYNQVIQWSYAASFFPTTTYTAL